MQVVGILVVAVLAGVAAAGIVTGLRRQQPVVALMFAGVGLIGVALPFSGPRVEAAPGGSPAIDVRENADFRTRWLENPTFYGEPVGNIHYKDGFLVAPFDKAWMESHPEVSDLQWRVMLRRIGAELLEKHKVTRAAAPEVPVGLARHISALGIDPLWALGAQLTNPITLGDNTYRVYFERAIFEMNRADGLGEIKRLDVGREIWNIDHGSVGLLNPQPDFWTTERQWLVGLALVLTVAGGVMLQRFGNKSLGIGSGF